MYRLVQSGVSDAPPVPSFTVTPNPATVGQTVKFDASGSSDPDGHIVTYAWDLTGDGKTDTTGSSASTTFAAAGTHAITLTVTDDGGVSASKTTSLVVHAATGGTPGNGGGSNGGSSGTTRNAAHLAGTAVHVTAAHRIANVLLHGVRVTVKSTARAHWTVSLIVDRATAKRLHMRVAKGVKLISIGSASRPEAQERHAVDRRARQGERPGSAPQARDRAPAGARDRDLQRASLGHHVARARVSPVKNVNLRFDVYVRNPSGTPG